MKGTERFKEILEKYISRDIILYGDPDVDGLISLYMMVDFCKMIGKNYTYYVNDHRYHGFTLNASSLRGKLVIASDFAISEHEIDFLVENDVVILSTDHHDVQSTFIDVVGESAEGIVINNQYPFEPEEDRYLSGAGVFYELICSLYPEFKTKLRDGLVGVTLLSDIRPTEGDKAKKYLRSTYSLDTETEYVKYLIDTIVKNDYGFGAPKLDRNFVDFNLSPTINALLRFNKTIEAVEFILGNGLTRGSQYRESQQNLVADMHSKAYVQHLASVTFIYLNDADFPDVQISDFIGLLCSDFKDKLGGKSTLGFVVANGKILRTSFRGRYDDVHYLSGFRHIGIDANGHGNAFGIKNFEPSQELWVDIDDLISELEADHEPTIKVIECNNLALAINNYGTNAARENCYVRDCYRTYFKYTGTNFKVLKETYKMEPFSIEDYASGRQSDSKTGHMKYQLDQNGNKIPKYIEYLIDGRNVKSFGVSVQDGIILPILDKGYVQLYVRPMIA